MEKLKKFQTLAFKSWKGTTRKNHISSIYRSAPQAASDLMIELLASKRGRSLETFLSKFPTKEFDSDDAFYWDIIGSSRRNIPIKEARDFHTNTVLTEGMAGKNGSKFKVVFGEDWFADGNVIVGEKNEVYPLRVIGDGINEGTDVVYIVELMGGVTGGMPVEELSNGKRFSVDYSPVEAEFSRAVGDIRFSSPTRVYEEFSHIRIKHEVPGNALDNKLIVGIPVLTKDNKKTVLNKWMHYVDYKLEETFSEEKNNLLVYGRSNKNTNGEYTNIGKSGGVIKMGAGIREQQSYGPTEQYNRFDLKLLEDILVDISTQKIRFADRIFILRTGERGAMQFHKAVLSSISGWKFLTLDNSSVNMVTKANSPLHGNALKAGFQFTEFLAPNGVIVKVEIDPMYDDPVRNKIMHPNGGVAESYRYDIYYMGTQEAPNIQLAAVKGSPEMRGYQSGMRNPFTGETNIEYMSTDKDGAVMHKQWTGGAMVLDPTKIMTLLPAILA